MAVRASMKLMIPMIPPHPPGAVFFLHGRDSPEGRLLLLERSLKLDHHIFSIGGAGQRGSEKFLNDNSP